MTADAEVRPPRIGPVWAPLLGFVALGIVDVLAEASRLPSSKGHAEARLVHYVSSFVAFVTVGVVAAWATLGFLKLRRAIGRRVYAAPAIAIAVLAALTLVDDLDGLAEKLSPRHAALVAQLLAQVFAFDAFAALFVAVYLGGTRARLVLLGPGIAAVALGALTLPGEYPAVHLWIVLVGGVFVACALADLPAPWARAASAATTRADGARAGSRRAIGAAVAATAALLASLFVPIPNAALAEMIASPGAFLAPFASRLRPLDVPRVDPPPAARAWFVRRAKTPATPHVPSHALPAGAVVVLITIDAVRADVVMSGKYDGELPNLAKLRADSVVFAEARSPAPQTVPSLTGVMTGKYFSQIYWSGGAPRHAWPAADRSPRFPALLRNAGVATVTFPSLSDLVSDKGVVRGFSEETVVKTKSGEPSPYWNEMLEAIKPRLVAAATDARPTFLFAHFLDPHAPYTRGGTDCEPFECYVREIGLVDQAIGEIRAVLDGDGLRDRSVLIVSADHGEAFGEHGTFFHATNLYEELLRVPLLVHGSMFAPHLVRAMVTLLDLGPTVLDLYGLDTPPGFMGESLAGVLLGEPPRFTRPIAADSGRFMEALYFDDGDKLIFDQRYRLLELYDLKKDPRERHPLYDETPGAADRLGLLHLLFEANAFKRPGYSRPFRK